MPSTPTNPPSYWAFISYSSEDRAWARWLQRAIETYGVPAHLVGRPTPAGPSPRRLRPIFRDRSELPADADLAGQVQSALERSVYLIVVCSPAAAASRWVNEEIRRFRAVHGDGRILTVIVAGSPSEEYEACFPPALRYRDGGGERVAAEPVAADLRPGGDGRRLAKLKLIAGMLGVGLDELARRDAQRRARQFAALAAVGFAGMTVMTALAGAALVARDEARRQRADAQGLIGFMLNNLRRRLDDSGRLDLMDGIGPRVLAYYAAQKPGALDATSLSQRADALRLMGSISEERGRLAEAEAAYRAAAATTAEQLARAPLDGGRIFDQAQSVYYVGELASQRGEEALAESSFKAYLALASRLTALDPRRDDWRMELVYARAALGSLYLRQGRTDEATADFAQALTVAQALAIRHPTDTDQALDLGQCRAWLADALEKQGRLAEARAQRLAEIDLYRALLAKDPTLGAARFSTIVAMRALARQAVLGGDVAGALDDYRQLADRAERLLAQRPDSMDLTIEAAVVEMELGETLLAAGRADEAAPHGRRALELTQTAVARAPAVQSWSADRDRARLLEAALAAHQGDRAGALALDQATLARLSANPPVGVNVDARWLLDRARLRTGDDLAGLGRLADARAQWAAAADDLSGPIERYEPRLLVVLEGAYARLGRHAQARAVAGRLARLTSAAPART